MPKANPADQLILKYWAELAPILFLSLSHDGKILESNRYTEKLTGKGLVGTHFKEVIVDFHDRFNLASAAQDPEVEHLINISRNKGLVQSFFVSFRKTDDQILVLGRLDTDELEQMRGEVLSLNQEMNNLMRELQKKNHQLAQLNEEKNRFLGMAAHDLRNPIGLIMSYSDFLLDEASGTMGEQHTSFVETINRTSSFMLRLVEDFLDVSAIEAGRFDLNIQSIDLPEFLPQCLVFSQQKAARKGVELSVELAPELPRLRADAPKIEQALGNLVSNAIEHSEDSSHILVHVERQGENIHFLVKDEGVGIPADELEKLFKAFVKTTSKKTGGEKSTGLGMLITRRIIEAHGGRIWVESQMGKGTTFHFELPQNPRGES